MSGKVWIFPATVRLPTIPNDIPWSAQADFSSASIMGAFFLHTLLPSLLHELNIDCPKLVSMSLEMDNR